jgi:flagellar hook-associated protein 2
MATDTISALGAGSGVDVKSLATNLVEAERAPRKAVLDKKIKASEGGISGYAAIKFVLGDLNTAFSTLKNQSAFNVMTTRNSHPSAFSVTTSATTAAESHSVSVSQLAKPQRSISPGFISNTTPVTASLPITLSLSVHGAAAEAITLPTSANTPESIVKSVNAAGKGITAQLINTGEPSYPIKILFTGQTGAASDFQITGLEDCFQNIQADSRGLTKVQTAQNALLTVDGVAITSATNKVQDAITGTTLDLFAATPLAETASLDFVRDTTGIKPKIEALVKAYNDATSMLGVVSDPKSSVETYGATLVGNSVVGSVRSQMRALITTNITTSAANTLTVRSSQINLKLPVTLNSATGVATKIEPSNPLVGFADMQSMIDSINAASNSTKVTASKDFSGNLVLSNSEGSDISVSGAEPNSLGMSTGVYKRQATAIEPNKIIVSNSQINLDLPVTLSSATGSATKIQPPADGFADLQSMIDAINAASNTTKVTASKDANGSLVLTNQVGSEGNDISVSGLQPNSLGIAAGIYKSRTPNALRDIGLSISAQGALELDSKKLDSLLQTNFDGVVTLLTGNQENLSIYSQAPGGVANAAVKKLTSMMDANSALASQSTNLTKKISAYKLDLDKLEARMSDLLLRYNRQFSAMESMVGQSKSTRAGLTSTFDGMMAAYTNK